MKKNFKLVKRYHFLAVVGFILLAFISSGCSVQKNAAASTEPGQKQEGQIPKVIVQKVQKKDISNIIVAGGQLVAGQSAVIGPKITGKVAAVPVNMGSRVKQGDVVLRLEDTDLQAQVQQAEAQVEVARANYEVAQKNIENAAVQLERYSQLLEEGAISQDNYDSIKLKYDQANSGVPAASIKQSEAALMLQKSQLANTVVTSPISGVVALRNADPGEIVSANTPAITVVDLSRMKVEFKVGEKEIGQLQMGQKVEVYVKAVQPKPFSGEIIALAPAADQQAKSFPVEVIIPNSKETLKQGMYAEVHLVAGQVKAIPAVPVDAVVSRGEQKVVYVVKDDQVEQRTVKTGIADEKFVAITGGLNPGEQVVINGQQNLKDGAKVMVQSGNPGATGQKTPGLSDQTPGQAGQSPQGNGQGKENRSGKTGTAGQEDK